MKEWFARAWKALKATSRRDNLIAIIGGVIVVLFVFVWLVALITTWGYTPTKEAPVAVLGVPLVTSAGALATAVTTLTASALGFTVAKVQTDGAHKGVTTTEVGDKLGKGVFAAIVAYLVVGVLVFCTWVLDPRSPELVSTFGASLLGWFLGGASAFFRQPLPPTVEEDQVADEEAAEVVAEADQAAADGTAA